MKNLSHFFLKAYRYLHLLSYFLLSNSVGLQAQWNYNFEAKTFGGGTTTYSGFGKIIEKGNGSLLVSGQIYFDSTYSLNFRGKYDIWMLTIDASVNKLNESVLGSSNVEAGPVLISLADSGYLIACQSQGNDSDITCFYTKANGNTTISLQLFKYNSSRQLLWNKCIGDTLGNVAITGEIICPTKDEGFILSAKEPSSCAIGSYPTIRKIDKNGNLQWKTCTQGNVGLGMPFLCAVESKSGAYFLGTGTALNASYYAFPNVTSYPNDVGLLKVDTNGAITQASVYGGNGIDKIHKILPQANGDLILVLSSTSTAKHSGEALPNYGSNLIWLIRVDSTGTVVQEAFFGGSAGGVAIQDAIQLSNGNIMIDCYGKSKFFMNQDSTNYHPAPITGSADILICEVDSDLNYIGARCYGGSGDEKANGIFQSSDGSIWLSGYTNSNDGDVDTIFNTFSNGWIIKLTEDSILGSKSSMLPSKQDVRMYPNPAQESVRLSFSSNLLPQQMSLQDVQGNVLQSLNQIQKNQRLTIGHLPNGLYLLRFTYANGQVLNKKLVVLR